MRFVNALPAKTEANLESIKGRTAEMFKTTVLYARRNFIPRLSFQTRVIYRGPYGRKVRLSAMDDSCMILWWIKNRRPYQLFVSTPHEFLDVQSHACAQAVDGYLLVRQDIRGCPSRTHHERFLNSRAWQSTTSSTKDSGADTASRTILHDLFQKML